MSTTARKELLSFWEQQEKPKPLGLYTRDQLREAEDARYEEGLLQGRGDYWVGAVAGFLLGVFLAGTLLFFLSL